MLLNQSDIALPFISGTQCAEPPTPNATLIGTEMHPEPLLSAGSLTDFDDPVDFACPRGLKFADDIGRATLQATCRRDNVWEEPSWQKCVESEFIP